MTKLMEWLSGLSLYLTVWLSIMWKKEYTYDSLDNVINFFPVITLVVFGIYSLSVVLWRTFTFNDCPEAAAELQEQISQAKEDLKSRGLKF